MKYRHLERLNRLGLAAALFLTFVFNSTAFATLEQTGTASAGGTSTTADGPAKGNTAPPPPVVGGQPRSTSPLAPGTGSVPPRRQISGAARTTGGINELSLQQAIQLAIQNNLSTLLARERVRQAEGYKQQALSPLLPNVSGTAYQASITQNLAALGFQPGTFPGITNTFIGPFNNFDARVRLVQSIINWSALENYRASRAGVRSAAAEELVTREQVATLTTILYLDATRAERAVAAAEADVSLAQTVLTLAQDQRNAGVATGVDVARAETRMAEQQVRLAQAHTSREQTLLDLQRVVGVTLGGQLVLTDPLRFDEIPIPEAQTAVAEAFENRPEIKLAQEQIRVSQLERAAVRGEYLPSLEFVSDYGVSGITPTNTALPTRRVAVQLNVPIFNGGLTRGRMTVAESKERVAELEFGNIRGQVEEDVRLGIATLRTAAAQVKAADDAVRLAQRELEMSRDRFSAGVADNLEVVNALTVLANARDTQTTALAQYNAARANLAAALGHAESFHW